MRTAASGVALRRARLSGGLLPSFDEQDRRVALVKIQVQRLIGRDVAPLDHAQPVGFDPGIAHFPAIFENELWFSHAPPPCSHTLSRCIYSDSSATQIVAPAAAGS